MTVQNPPIFVQEGSHPAEDTRRALEALAAGTSGYSSASALAVTERASLTNMSVDVAGGGVWVPGTEGTFQGSYFCDNRGTTNLTIAAADGTNPRIDLVVAQVEDSEYSGAVDQWSLTVVTGTPAASPVAPSAPANSVSLATVSVAALASQIVDANITDLRDLDVTAHGSVNIPGDLTVTTDASVGGDLTVTGNLTAANQGMVRITTVNVSATNTVNLDNIFTSQFLNYRLVIQQTGGSSTDYMYMRYRISGSTLTSSSYYEAVRYSTFTGGNSLLNVIAGTEFRLGIVSAKSGYTLDFYSPNVASQCSHNVSSVVYGAGLVNTYGGGGVSENASAKTGISLFAGSGITWSGKVVVYGYNE